MRMTSKRHSDEELRSGGPGSAQERWPIARAMAGAGSQAGREEGFLLLAVLCMLVLLTLALATAAPKIATQLRREKELEAVHRGEQYERAIGLYYRKFGHYPANIKELTNSDGIRFLRKQYTDPFTGKNDWVLLHMGQVQMLGVPGMPGATGQPPFGSVPGTSPGQGISGTSPIGGSSGMFGSPSASGSSGPMGGIGAAAPGQSSPFSSTSTSFGGTGAGTTGTNTTGSGENDSFANPGSNIGAGPIVGVGLPVKEKSFKLLHGKQTSYNKWQFVFDPAKEQLKAAGVLNNGGVGPGQGMGQGMGQGVSPGSGTSNGFGSNGTQGNSNSGFGNSGFGGSSSGFGGSSGFGNSGFGNSGFGNSGSGSSGFGNSDFGGSSPSSPPTQSNHP